MEKLKKQEVILVDTDAKTFTVKGRDSQIKVTEETTFQKGRTDSTFEELVTVGASLEIEVLINVAKAIKSK